MVLARPLRRWVLRSPAHAGPIVQTGAISVAPPPFTFDGDFSMAPGFLAGYTLSASREAPVLEDNSARVEKCARSQTSVLAVQTALPEEIALLCYL